MIRKATQKDTGIILKLYTEQFEEMAKHQPYFIQPGDQSAEFVEKMILSDDSDILVYDDNGKVVGFILIQSKARPDFPFIVKRNYCYIMDVIVTGKSRGNGIGTALMNATKDWAKQRNLEFILLDVLSNNIGAISLYEKLGFSTKAQEMYCKL